MLVPVGAQMDRQEFGTHYHHILFKNACHERKGSAFQTLFERIMQKHDSTFIAVKPSGREGDWKCDGFSQVSGTVYQCYAPEGMTHAKAAAKVDEDFSGARKHWETEMLAWTFVWSAHDALPPQVLKALQRVRQGKHGVAIDDWDRERLWGIVRALSELVRSEFLGAVPELAAAPDTTAAEIKVLLTFLTARPLAHDSTEFDLTEIAQKLAKNNLTDSVRAMVMPAVPVARLLHNYLNRHPDPDYSTRAAQALAEEYRRLVADGPTDTDRLFWQIVLYVASNDLADPKRFWASLGIVTYYFELCDIFER